MVLRTLALAAATTVFVTAAQAHSHKLKSLEIVHPWCFETKDAAQPVAVFMTIRNAGARPDRLLRAAVSIAGKTELHGASGPGVASVPVAGRGAVDLKRGGPHVLLSGMKRELGPYDSFVMTLTFARAGKVEVEVMVEEASVAEPPKH